MASAVMAPYSSSSSSSSAAAKFLFRANSFHLHLRRVPISATKISAIARSDPNGSRNGNNSRLLLLRLGLAASRVGGAAMAVAGSAASWPLPALAEQMEKAKLFDFNLTLPAIAVEFLLLMVALDKLYFTPLGKFMDERDARIRAELAEVKDTSGEVKQLEEQAAAVMKAARAEISAALNKMKKETSAELEQKLAEGRKRVEAELAEALQSLERQKEETIKALDSQITALSQEIVNKVLPSA